MFSIEPYAVQQLAAAQELRDCNGFTGQFGLSLREEQIQSLVARRFGALRDTGRVEFGGGILPKLIYAFCDSPYISQETYEDTITELQDLFYYYKNESEDRLSDDELISFMKTVFDGRAQGSLDYLAGTSLEELCHDARNGWKPGDAERFF
jgi:hypothetical protein